LVVKLDLSRYLIYFSVIKDLGSIEIGFCVGLIQLFFYLLWLVLVSFGCVCIKFYLLFYLRLHDGYLFICFNRVYYARVYYV
jgi:hypothetical protein